MIINIITSGQRIALDDGEGVGAASGDDRGVRIDGSPPVEKPARGHSPGSLVEALKDERYEVRETAYRELRRIGYAAISELVRALKEESLYSRMYAALAISDQIIAGPEREYGDDVVDALAHALRDKSIYVRRSAYDALKVLENNRIRGSLIRSLAEPDHSIRLETIMAIENLGDEKSDPGLLSAVAKDDAPGSPRCHRPFKGRKAKAKKRIMRSHKFKSVKILMRSAEKMSAYSNGGQACLNAFDL